jgi:predicted small secreted protein
MKARLLLAAVLTAVVLGTAACSTLGGAGHRYLMRGQVVEVAGSEVVLCVGSRDGATAGQELTVYKLVSSNVGGPKNPTRWEKVRVGTVRIGQVVDEHFARAEVTSGDVQVNNVVELKP